MYNSKIISSIAMTVAMMATTSCSSDKEEANIIDRPTDLKIENRQYSIDVLEALGRVSGPAVSPDGKKVLYNVSYESVEQNKSNNDLYVKNIDGTDSVRLTKTAKSEGGAAWIENGEKIAFLYADEAGVPQLWVMNADGSGRKCVSSLENGVEGFKFSPDSKKVVLVSSVKYSREAKDVYSDLPEATGRIIDDLMYKHWDQWTKDIPHPFVADFTGDKVENVEDIMASEPYECPMRPFGGVEAFAW